MDSVDPHSIMVLVSEDAGIDLAAEYDAQVTNMYMQSSPSSRSTSIHVAQSVPAVRCFPISLAPNDSSKGPAGLKRWR
jgi:hypothetical protein